MDVERAGGSPLADDSARKPGRRQDSDPEPVWLWCLSPVFGPPPPAPGNFPKQPREGEAETREESDLLEPP